MARNDDAGLAEARQKLDDAIREAEKAGQEGHADHAAKKEAVEKQREHFLAEVKRVVGEALVAAAYGESIIDGVPYVDPQDARDYILGATEGHAEPLFKDQ